MKVIAVIPAYNEGSALADVIKGAQQYVDEVIVIDDGSKDNTFSIAKHAGAVTAKHFVNRGQGAGLQTGMEMALKRGADIVVHIDADGQHPVHQIKDLIKPIENGEAEFVFGSRFLGEALNIPTSRKYVLKLATWFTRLLSGMKITDPHSGFRAIHKKAVPKLRLRQDRMAHASEILQLASRHGLSYKEIPVTITYTDYSLAKGQSSWNAFKIVFNLIKGTLL